MPKLLTLSLAAWIALALGSARAQEPDAAPLVDARVLRPARAPADERLERAVTLDGYFPLRFEGDLAAWQLRRERLRRQVLVAAGLWPMPAVPAGEPVIHGRSARAGYTVEKVFFASYPGLYVTGNLYRPDPPRGVRGPAVLSPHGHQSGGRLMQRSDSDVALQLAQGFEASPAAARYYMQARCAQLARMGCVVFHYDMLGYGDSRQLEHAAGFSDVAAELWLASSFGLQTFSSIRALDFLASLPEVDPRRIGVTGASGGGTQTFILCAIDDRPAAAFPAVMVSTSMQGGCACENAPHLRVGTGNVELAALCAPRPLALTGANDWTIEIEEKGLPELERVYGLFGARHRVSAECHPSFDHNYNLVSRRWMYAFFADHLGLGLTPPIDEEAFVPLAPAELAVFDEQHPLPADAVDLAVLRAWLVASAERELAALVPNDAEDLVTFRRVVGGALEILVHSALPAAGGVSGRVLAEEQHGEWRVQRLVLSRSGAREELPALLVVPRDFDGTVVVGVAERGKQVFFDAPGTALVAAADVLAHGAAFLALDALLTGEFFADGAPVALPRDARRHADYPGYTSGYNPSLAAWRVHDVLSALAFARDLAGAQRVRLVGDGTAGRWALLARALAGDLVERAAADWRADPTAAADGDDPELLPGLLRYGGLATLAALGAPHELRLIGTRALPEPMARTWRAAGAAGRARAQERADAAELARWLAGP